MVDGTKRPWKLAGNNVLSGCMILSDVFPGTTCRADFQCRSATSIGSPITNVEEPKKGDFDPFPPVFRDLGRGGILKTSGVGDLPPRMDDLPPGGGGQNPGGSRFTPRGGGWNLGGGQQTPRGGSAKNPGGDGLNPGGGMNNPGGGEHTPEGGTQNPRGGWKTPGVAQRQPNLI